MVDSLTPESLGERTTGLTPDRAANSQTAQVPAPAPRQASGRLYLTSELRSATGLPRTHLDYYLREGLVRPSAKTETGFLLFDDNELASLRDIVAMRQAGVSLREIRRRLAR